MFQSRGTFWLIGAILLLCLLMGAATLLLISYAQPDDPDPTPDPTETGHIWQIAPADLLIAQDFGNGFAGGG